MNIKTLGLVLALLPSAAGSQPPAAARPDVLQVAALEQSYELSVPVSRLVMSIPRGRLEPTKNPLGGSADHPRYFYFVDRAFNVSGWFEPAQGFRGMQKFWEDETQNWRKRGFPAPVDVKFSKVGGWDAVVYDWPHASATDSHIRAHWVEAGTWIDIHISLSSERPSAQIRAALQTFLEGVIVRERSR